MTNGTWILVGAFGLLSIAWAALLTRSGPLTWWRRLWAARRRVLAEDALKHLHAQEWGGRRATANSLAGALVLSPRRTLALITQMEAQGWLRSTGAGLRLTPAGARLALQVIRSHRLWERYLVDEARMPLAEVHAEAERREHAYSPEAMDAFDASLGYPTTDPHGDPIPTADGDLARVPTKPVTDWPLKSGARIVHLEDEPRTVFAQIDAVGLRPGQTIWVTEADRRRIVLFDGEETHVLAPAVAANIFVAPAPVDGRPCEASRLSALQTGERGVIQRLDEALQGFTRRRLLDLGLTPGTAIAVESSSFAGDPRAYRVRGSLIALRADQARYVLVDTSRNGGLGDA